jgi:hypothetical protein
MCHPSIVTAPISTFRSVHWLLFYKFYMI